MKSEEFKVGFLSVYFNTESGDWLFEHGSFRLNDMGIRSLQDELKTAIEKIQDYPWLHEYRVFSANDNEVARLNPPKGMNRKDSQEYLKHLQALYCVPEYQTRTFLICRGDTETSYLESDTWEYDKIAGWRMKR